MHVDIIICAARLLQRVYACGYHHLCSAAAAACVCMWVSSFVQRGCCSVCMHVGIIICAARLLQRVYACGYHHLCSAAAAASHLRRLRLVVRE
jgi:hypothetical protein